MRNTQRIIFFSGLDLLVLRCNSSPSLCVVLLLQLLQLVQCVVALTAVTIPSLLQGFVSSVVHRHSTVAAFSKVFGCCELTTAAFSSQSPVFSTTPTKRMFCNSFVVPLGVYSLTAPCC